MVSVSGDGLEARALEAAGSMLKATVHEPTVPPGGKGLWGHKGWQLPAYIQHVFNDLVEKGRPHDWSTYGLAVGIVRNWSQGHDGKGHRVKPSTVAAARKAMREWDAMRARSKAMTRAREGRVEPAELCEAAICEADHAAWAEGELRRAGLFDRNSDYGGMLGKAVMRLVRTMAGEGHSGASAAMVTQIFERLARYKPLTPLTDDPAEWQHHGEDVWGEPGGVWQSRRDPEAFSRDGGKTHWLSSDRQETYDEDGATWTRTAPTSKWPPLRRSAPARPLREASDDGVTDRSAMVALYPSPPLADALAVPGGLEPDDLHVTLAFLGELSAEQERRLRNVVASVAAEHRNGPLRGEISGTGVFSAGPKPVTYASVDLPGLPDLRDRLVRALDDAGIPVNREHGFTPHMTLAYRDLGAHRAEPIPVRFGSLYAVVGDRDRSRHTLGRGPVMRESGSSSDYKALLAARRVVLMPGPRPRRRRRRGALRQALREAAEDQERRQGQASDPAFEKLHPRAGAGSAQGGQFVKRGDGGSGAKATTHRKAKAKPKAKARPKVKRKAMTPEQSMALGVSLARLENGDQNKAARIERRILRDVFGQYVGPHDGWTEHQDDLVTTWVNRQALAHAQSILGDRLHATLGRRPDDPVGAQLRALTKFPDGILRDLMARGLQGIWIGNAPVNEQDDMASILEPQPRGVTGWDAAGGVWAGHKVVVRAISLGGTVLHELGHAIGEFYGVDDSPELIAAHQRLYPKLNPYLQQEGPGGRAGRQEMFAEAVREVLNVGPELAGQDFDPALVAWVRGILHV